ncbi:Iron(3+)-hydroxamate import ATP-binding protein FhuC [Pigmentiphaga humi]|uniref:Iron(3+)-hydroxamate import ATP-binding protein FhuC n=1 Tax=Pigmentiphaga humi TaxID=2478468 RepID=A0A3P4AYC7_9BURK|nr:ATP-binding cassette domain-containing protein [Pigmentiphaga humi]VCU68782.1 Iron(3+)-hydroxamate import ATP-binding protein FhuC [Pigmentiphaga humi]
MIGASSARPAAPALLELRDAGFRAAGETILQPLTLAIPAGRVLGVIGHNGSGKSTLGRMLARQLLPSTGRLLLRGAPAERMAARQFAREVAYLPQHIPAAAGMTVQELVGLGRYPWLGAFRSPTREDRDRVRESMATTGVADLSTRLVDTLSGGERQRVWLAMLVAQQAHSLILDEPTSALDIRHQVSVLGLLRQLARTQGVGVVVILHDIYMAGRYCDDIIALRRGRVVAAGGREEILAPDVLRAIYDIEMDVMIHQASGDRVVCLRE